jgi:hypothetical protein
VIIREKPSGASVSKRRGRAVKRSGNEKEGGALLSEGGKKKFRTKIFEYSFFA